MATQGLVSVRQGGKMVLKIITGMDGYNARKVAGRIKAFGRLPTAEEAYELAMGSSFGSSISLIVLTPDRAFHKTGEKLDDLYRSTFDQPRFNPRWPSGLVDEGCSVIVDF